MEHLDNVKSWLEYLSFPSQSPSFFGILADDRSSCDIAFSEGQLNLNWTTIMKTVNDNPAEFFREGGWSFLEVDSDASSDGSEEGSVFEMSEDGYEEESDDDESDYDENASDDEGSEMDEDDSGEDWSEMEEEGTNHLLCFFGDGWLIV